MELLYLHIGVLTFVSIMIIGILMVSWITYKGGSEQYIFSLIITAVAIFLFSVIPVKQIIVDANDCQIVKNNQSAIVLCGGKYIVIRDIETYNKIDTQKIKRTFRYNIFGGNISEFISTE